MKTKDKLPPLVLGWREYIDLPEWGVTRLRAKIDTGARTSAIHVENLEELPGGRVRFEVIVCEKPLKTVTVEAMPTRRTTVKPSSGHRQKRWVMRTTMVVGPLEHDIELSLVSRESMLNRMLVGRKALPPHVLVNPNRTYRVSRKRLPRKSKEK